MKLVLSKGFNGKNDDEEENSYLLIFRENET